MKKFKQLSIIYPTFIMFAICLVITAALAGTNSITRDKIAELNAEKENAAKSELISADSYETDTVEYEGEKYEYSIARTGGDIEGYIFKIDEKGYGGTITAMIAVNTDGTIKAVRMIDVSNETPGLGQNTAKESFTKQFEGKSGSLEAVKNGTASEDVQIDAVASATISSRAATRAVNKAVVLANIVLSSGSAEKKD